MSGHSKWANTKHRKAGQDAVRGKIFTKIGKEIAVAVKDGGPDSSTNRKLKDIIVKAKANNMPNDGIDRAIKKAAGDKDAINYETIIYEGYGPNGIAVIVETLTDNKNRTAASVRSAFTKGKGNMGTTGCVSFMFDEKGQILIEKTDDMNDDDIMIIALDAGAEDFLADEEGYEIITSVDDFSDICAKLESQKFKLVSAEVKMIPQTTNKLDEENAKSMQKMIDMFDDDEDVQNVWHNWDEE
ncbi:MAG TPA: YebC/PmpR family DNA-binding transcriptional regulator [Clostridiales bacterium]|nr:MAG: transcriptional regulator [Clostridiales bacterium GWD2_32_19]HCC07833.1 YebC/PmpR family DNA-binding transcriptional regulator [Clostridiales bacterium]